MKSARSSSLSARVGALLSILAGLVSPSFAAAHETAAQHVHFQKPGSAAAPAPAGNLQFRRASAPAANSGAPEPAASAERGSQQVVQAARQTAAKPLSEAPQGAKQQTVRQAAAKSTARPTFAQPASRGDDMTDFDQPEVRLAARQISGAPSIGERVLPRRQPGLLQAGFSEMCLGCSDPACGITEPACGCDEPGCGICESTCGIVEPGCGLEAGCGLIEPACGCGEPDCGVVGCGTCVAPPGPDYWCFPVCLPRFKDLSVWGGVHGFKGPRDTLDGPSDNNFGFQEGVNIGGRAPLVGLIFPQLSYQLGYQSVQSQLSGNSAGSSEDRLQHFVTTGLFRRVPVGLQFGAVWDYMHDDLLEEQDFQQLRYEISLKSQRGLEFGFWGASHTNSNFVGLQQYQTVDQYCGFFRYHFRDAGELRFWGGGTNDNEGIFGADAYVPFSNRFSLQTGFNYLIPQEDPGDAGAGQESWNVGINLVWHYGQTAKMSRTNPHRPLFSTADNGWMFIDTRP